MTQNRNATLPAAIPVEEIAAQMEITPDKLRRAIGLLAASGYTVNLGLGIHVKVEILDEADHCDDAMIELARLRLAARMRRWTVLAAPPASKSTPGGAAAEAHRRGSQRSVGAPSALDRKSSEHSPMSVV